jgi:polyhydroxybutyrate depolymerase
MMCHRLARQAADVFAGIAVIAGAMNFTAADSELPIAVLIVHGTEDRHVRFEGGRPGVAIGRAGERRDASVADAVAYYRARNQLSPACETVVAGQVRTETWSTGKDGDRPPPVRVITLDGGGHAWPTLGGPRRLLGDAPFPFDASAAIVAFCREAPPRRR